LRDADTRRGPGHALLGELARPAGLERSARVGAALGAKRRDGAPGRCRRVSSRPPPHSDPHNHTPADIPDSEIEVIARLIFLYLRSEYADHSEDGTLIQLLFKMPAIFKMDELALTTAVVSDPTLVNRFHQLQDRKIYGKYAPIARRELWSKKPPTINRHRMSDEAIAGVREVLAAPGHHYPQQTSFACSGSHSPRTRVVRLRCSR
jgi:hypothetical protein